MKVDYKTRQLLSEESVSKTQVEYAVDSTKLELQSNLLATKKSLAEAEQTLKELKSIYPLDVQSIVETMLVIRDYKNGIEIIESLQKEFNFVE